MRKKGKVRPKSLKGLESKNPEQRENAYCNNEGKAL
jgi:hypothetical protein